MRIDKRFSALVFSFCLTSPGTALQAEVFLVGPAHPFPYPAAVAGLTGDGDTVFIDAGNYSGAQACAAWTSDSLLIRGTGGLAWMEAAGAYVWGKGTWVAAGNGITVENIGFSGASVPDHNGAGIRLDGSGLTVRNCRFSGNENGILGGSSGDVLIEHSEFSHNGYGDGYSHNIYINHAASLTVKYCYLHHAHIGQELKSRAHRNYILYNRISNEATGDASREIDLPNGGLALVMGNIIHQGPMAQNGNLLGYGAEGLTNDPPHDLFLIHNTFVDERGYGGLFIDIPQAGTGLMKAYNNVFTSPTAAWITGNPATLDTAANRFLQWKSGLQFTDTLQYDYHILPSSPLADAGTDPGLLDTVSLLPAHEYVHPAQQCARMITGNPDIGAHEAAVPSGKQPPDCQPGKPLLRNRSGGNFDLVPAGITGPFTLRLLDPAGRLIRQTEHCGPSPLSFSLSGLPPGTYLLELLAGKNRFPFRIIRQGDDFQ